MLLLSIVIFTTKLSFALVFYTVNVNARDIKVSMLFNLLLASITISLCLFFYFLVTFNSFYIIPVAKENVKVKLARAVPASISKAAMYLLTFLLMFFFFFFFLDFRTNVVFYFIDLI